jgi:hypothetical protein
LALDKWIEVLGYGLNVTAEVNAISESPFRLVFNNFTLQASTYYYRHNGGGCYQPMNSTVNKCAGGPFWVHTDSRNGNWVLSDVFNSGSEGCGGTGYGGTVYSITPVFEKEYSLICLL